ncbi:hypothetical protein L7F22_052292 [Adiantum nelumboides]|nr:hypothetical protein [Adiantum nelumboides]
MDDKWLPYINYRSAGRASARVYGTIHSEKLILLAAVSSPLLSPGRERAKLLRKKSKHSSSFAFPRKAKASIEAEEPSSPKVSCIGQVKTNKNNCGSQTDKRKQFNTHTFLKEYKWLSFFSLCRDTRSSPSRGPPCGGREVSRCGLPACESSFFCTPVRSCGVPFAKSLILLQECVYKTQILSKSDVETLVCNDGKGYKRDVVLLTEQAACRQGDHVEGKATNGVSSLNLIASNAHDVGTCNTLHNVSHTEGKEVTRSDMCECEKTNCSSLPLILCKECDILDPNSALPLHINCEQKVETSETAHLSTVKTPVDDMTCTADVRHMSVVGGEESKIQTSCKAAMQWESCEEDQCAELKEHSCCVLNNNDRHEWQGQQFYDDTDPKRKPVSLNVFDRLVSSIPAFSHLLERDLHRFVIGNDTDSIWDIHIVTRSGSAQAAFIFLDHGFYENAFQKDTRHRLASSQTWTVQSFHDARCQAKFFRSYSATSYRTAFTLQRCKSEPRKSY